jgi:hypothetical protein
MFKLAFTEKDLFRVLVLAVLVGVIGIGSIANTVMIAKDGVYWIECAHRIDSIESTSGTFGTSEQNYLFCPEGRGGSGMQGNSGMGVSVGINGISVYEHDSGYVPPLAVYTGTLGTAWNQITVTYTNKQPRIYLNGTLVRTGLVSPRKNVFAPRQLGGRDWGYFKGSVRAVRIWNRALSDAEVLTLSTEEAIVEEGLVGYWKFDEGAGTMGKDNSGNKHHATIRGPAWVACGESYALQFDGIDDTVTWNYSAPANYFTVSALVQTTRTHDIPSVLTTLSKIESPGLSFMIFFWHRLLSCLGLGGSNLDWVMAGQTLSLICRILSLVPLYYLGKQLVGGRHAFWAVLILIFLPWPAEWGHDVLREWPHLLFLSSGLLMVFLAFTYRRIIFFLLAGLLAGIGQVIRPECAQIIIYALFGLIFSMICPHELMARKKAILGTMLLILGFAIIFVPYVQMRGEILPLKLQKLMATDNDTAVFVAPVSIPNATGTQNAGFLTVSMDGVINLIQTLSENLYYYFFPFMLVGLYLFFRDPKKNSFNRWFIAGFIVSNFLMYTALYHHWGYISRRHLLPLTAMTVFFVPRGIETVAGLFSRQKADSGGSLNRKKQALIFRGLIIVGILACLPKLAEPLGKVGFLKAAEYLKQNTPPDAIVAAPDKRITFYAQREGLEYGEQISGQADYIVKVIKEGDGKQDGNENISEVYSTWVDKKENSKLVIYKVFRRE